MQPIIFPGKKSEIRSIFDDIKSFYLETLLRNTYIKSYVLVLVCVTRKRWLFLGMMIFAKSPFFWRVGLRKSFVTLLNNFKSKPPLYSHSKQNQFKKWPSNINLKYLYSYSKFLCHFRNQFLFTMAQRLLTIASNFCSHHPHILQSEIQDKQARACISGMITLRNEK